jgi:hypothetical protein
LSWVVFVIQFERRFSPTTFIEKINIGLQSYKQNRKTIVEYEVGFNKIVHFVPHVANNDVEKASLFRQGLRPSIRHTLGAFPLIDFHTTMEQPLDVEMQHQYKSESSQKYLGGDQSHGQDEKNGHSSGPVSKKGKFKCHHQYRGKSAESSALGRGAPMHRAVPKLGMGLV